MAVTVEVLGYEAIVTNVLETGVVWSAVVQVVNVVMLGSWVGPPS